jgi:hypothetical protein
LPRGARQGPHAAAEAGRGAKEESSKFFKWVVMYPVDTHQVYAEHLLTFFHAKGLLLNKKAVITKSKQHKQRYIVIYDVNGQVFSKIYNSIREIREDTV